MIAWLKSAGHKARKLAEDRFSRDGLAAELIRVLEQTHRDARR